MTPRILWLIACILLAMAMAMPSSAEIYKYRDADGVLRFTDNLQEVPKDQREQVESYHEVKTKKDPEVQPDQKDAAGQQDDEMARQAEELKKEKELLDAEYAKLEEDRKLLVESSQKEERSDEEDAELRRNIESFNTRIKAYDEKLKVFEDKVGKYNAQVE